MGKKVITIGAATFVAIIATAVLVNRVKRKD
jgi:hypothetical protein